MPFSIPVPLALLLPPLMLLISPIPHYSPPARLLAAPPCSLVFTASSTFLLSSPPPHSQPLPLTISKPAPSSHLLNSVTTIVLLFLLSTMSNFNKNNEVIITGTRMPNCLWSLPLTPPTPHQANGILRTDKPKHDLAIYHHATLGSPVLSTLLRAIRQGHLTTFPGLTTNLISKHLPNSIASVLGHQDQESQHLRSTKLALPLSLSGTSISDADIAPPLASRCHQLCAMLLPCQEIIKSYSDQTGRFPVPSSRGNHYIFVMYHQDTNSIHAEPIPNRKASSIRDAWEKTHWHFLHQVIHPTCISLTMNAPRI